MYKTIYIQCSALDITADEIIQNIPKNVYNEIKVKNSHPYFQAYSIIHDGVSKPRNIEDNTYKPIEWSKDVIRGLKGIVKKGLQFFVGHNSDNSTEGRRSIGEVIADFQKTINDKLHHIVIGYFPDRSEAQKYDINSIEANIITEDYPDLSIAKKIQKLTGIALGNSQVDRPAFPGAIRLGTVQAFGDDNGDKHPPKPNNNTRKEIPVTFEEIKNAVKSMNIFPNQLFTMDDLKNDREFGKVFDQADSLDSKQKEFDDKLKEKEEEIKKLNRSISESNAHSRLEKIMPTFETDDKKLTDLQKIFIQKEFDPKNFDDLSDEKITEFVKSSLDKYPEYASIFGNKKEDDSKEGDNSNNNDSDNGSKDDIDQVIEEILK